MARAILIVEDEVVLAKNMRTYLLREGFDVEVAGTGEEALACVETFHPDVILLDYSLPNMDGLGVLNRLRKSQCHAKVIMVTGQGSVEGAVEAMKLGAYDYLTKPVALSELRLVIDRAVGTERLASALHYYHDKEARESGLAKLVGNSPPMMALKDTIRRLLDAEKRLLEGEPPAVLITGDTGTGKELVARALHFDGSRHDKPFIELNCASIPGALLEAELFGYEKGAFTDAKERKMGLVEAADGGTLFLDEIGEVDPSVQVKLLKLLEEKTVRRVGGLREQRVNIRVIAATNRNLEKMVHEGKFRSDLFFRLRIVYISLPPLRVRQNDVLLLARRFLTQHGTRYGKPLLRFSELAEKRLLEYSWPGNVRELRNATEQAVLVAQGDVVEAESFAFCHTLDRPAAIVKPAEPRSSAAEPPHAPGPDSMNLEEVERRMLSHALVKTAGNVTRAAKLLGVTRDMLRYRMEKYGIIAPH